MRRQHPCSMNPSTVCLRAGGETLPCSIPPAITFLNPETLSMGRRRAICLCHRSRWHSPYTLALSPRSRVKYKDVQRRFKSQSTQPYHFFVTNMKLLSALPAVLVVPILSAYGQAIQPASASSRGPVVDLGYVKYCGHTNHTAGIKYFRGIQ